MLGTWGLSAGLVSDGLSVLHLLHKTQLLSHTHDRSGLLRSHDLGDAKLSDGLRAETLSGQQLGNLASKGLVSDTSLRHSGLARLRELLVHLHENLVDLGEVVRALDGDGDGLCAGDGVGVAHVGTS